MGFIESLIATLVGVFFGFILGLKGDRWLIKRSEGNRRLQLVKALLETIQINENLLNEVEKEISRQPDLALPKSLDLTILNATAAIKYELLGSIVACQAVDQARSKLIEIDERLNLIRERTDTPRSFNNKNLAEQVNQTILEARKDIEAARKRLEGLKREEARISRRLPF